MTRSNNYKTKQMEAVLDYMIAHKDSHVTAAEIVAHFCKMEVPIGRTTVFRNLDKLAESGKVRRYVTDGVSGACYQYAEESCHSHFHLKCEGCGELQHFECDELDGLQNHLLTGHSIKINMYKTVFYGTCEECGG
ncbi:MAG: transcriptional repressor [Defluviitaleaceae bacterium]|nr:transcriptional repressor [Defluviitaleaceae bacterium]